MIFKKTVLVIALASLLVACGGGGGDSSSNSGSSNNGSDSSNTMSDLDKAKQLIQTTNTIVSYYDSFDEIQKTYQPSIDAVAEISPDIEDSTNLLLTLSELALQDAKGSTKTYSAQDIDRLYAASELYAPDFKLTNNALKIEVNGLTAKVSGSTDFERWAGFKFVSGQNPISLYADKTTLQVKQLSLSQPSVVTAESTHVYSIFANSELETVNANKKKATVKFTDNSSVSILYADAKIFDERTENEMATSVTTTLKNIELTTDESFVGTFKELSGQAKAVTMVDNGNSFVRLIPYELKLDGVATVKDQDNISIQASAKLNNDLNKPIDITGNKESINNFLNISLNIVLTGNLKAKNKQTPFSLKVNGLRNEFKVGNATADIDVDGNALNIQFVSSNLDQDRPTVAATVKHKNGAYVSIPDLDNFVSTKIMVGSTSYGDLSKVSGSLYNARFTDNTIITIAP